jgi:hypothetical protein
MGAALSTTKKTYPESYMSHRVLIDRRHYGCRDFLFQAKNRRDVELKPGHILAISAFRCADDCHDWWSP